MLALAGNHCFGKAMKNNQFSFAHAQVIDQSLVEKKQLVNRGKLVI